MVLFEKKGGPKIGKAGLDEGFAITLDASRVGSSEATTSQLSLIKY